jgi:hypothetical protein
MNIKRQHNNPSPIKAGVVVVCFVASEAVAVHSPNDAARA